MKRLPVLSVGLYRRLLAHAAVNGRLEALKRKQPRVMGGWNSTDRENDLGQNAHAKRRGAEINIQVFGRKLGLVSRLVGCSHRDLSRPFVDRNTSYRSCLKCGARKQFNPETFETFGTFYAPPVRTL